MSAEKKDGKNDFLELKTLRIIEGLSCDQRTEVLLKMAYDTGRKMEDSKESSRATTTATGLAMLNARVMTQSNMSFMHIFQPLFYVSVVDELHSKGFSDAKAEEEADKIQSSMCDLLFDRLTDLGIVIGSDNDPTD